MADIMSVKKHILEINPSKYLFKKEEFVIRDFACPKCHGSGEFVDIIMRNDIRTNICDFCGGSGSVKADVTVSWKPDIDNIK